MGANMLFECTPYNDVLEGHQQRATNKKHGQRMILRLANSANITLGSQILYQISVNRATYYRQLFLLLCYHKLMCIVGCVSTGNTFVLMYTLPEPNRSPAMCV